MSRKRSISFEDEQNLVKLRRMMNAGEITQNQLNKFCGLSMLNKFLVRLETIRHHLAGERRNGFGQTRLEEIDGKLCVMLDDIAYLSSDELDSSPDEVRLIRKEICDAADTIDADITAIATSAKKAQENLACIKKLLQE